MLDFDFTSEEEQRERTDGGGVADVSFAGFHDFVVEEVWFWGRRVAGADGGRVHVDVVGRVSFRSDFDSLIWKLDGFGRV